MKKNNLKILLSSTLILTLSLTALPLYARAEANENSSPVVITNEDSPITSSEASESDRTCQVSVTCASSFSVTIPKKIVLPGTATDGKHEVTYDIKVKGNIGSNEYISVIPEPIIALSQEGKQNVNATVTQTHTNYRLSSSKSYENDTLAILPSELNSDLGKTDKDTGKISVPKLSAGAWSGSYIYNIKLNKD